MNEEHATEYYYIAGPRGAVLEIMQGDSLIIADSVTGDLTVNGHSSQLPDGYIDIMLGWLARDGRRVDTPRAATEDEYRKHVTRRRF